MNEKRFVPISVEWTDGFIQDHIGDRDLFNIGAVCNLLNELSEENEELKQKNKELEKRQGRMYQSGTILSESNRLLKEENEQLKQTINDNKDFIADVIADCKRLQKENEQLKESMIGVVDRYIKNVECNPPSSARTYLKIKGALINIREDLRDLICDVE